MAQIASTVCHDACHVSVLSEELAALTVHNAM